MKKTTQKGFTLIELMVSVTLFAIVMVMGVGAILAIVNGNRKNQSLDISMNNLNYAIENMTRLMKTGHGFSQENSCATDDDSDIHFTTTEGQSVTYSRATVDGVGRLELTTDSNPGEYVTAPEIDIKRLCFTLRNDTGIQPAVVMVIAGHVAGKGGTESDFSLHSSVTQRAVQY